MASSPYLIVIVAAVAGAAISIGYYQFFYVTTINQKPIVPDVEITTIRIVEGASSESNPEFMVPQVATVVIGVNNTVRWINEDNVPHTITSDSDYRDPVSGLFDSRERPTDEGGAFVMPGQDYEFTFTKSGQIDYHHEPHPWVQGTIIVREP